MGENPVTNSNWGEANLEFIGSSDFQYFNLVVDGRWLIQDDPILSLEGAGVSQALTFNFDLENSIGTDVSSIDFIASLNDTPLGAPPSETPSTTTVGDVAIATGGCLTGGTLPLLTTPLPFIGGIPKDWWFHSGMPNQDVGFAECAPAAFSNSLMWLDKKGEIPNDKKSVEGLKDILMFNPPLIIDLPDPLPDFILHGGTPFPNWTKKRDALSDFVTTKFLGPGGSGTGFIMNDPNIIGQVIQEMKRGEDVEIWGQGHAAVLTCVIEFTDGRAQLCITHDTQQGVPGGTVTQKAIYNPITGQFETAAYGMPVGSKIRGFISESRIPEPSSVLGLLTLGTLGAVSTLKRKLKHSKEKETTKVVRSLL